MKKITARNMAKIFSAHIDCRAEIPDMAFNAGTLGGDGNKVRVVNDTKNVACKDCGQRVKVAVSQQGNSAFVKFSAG